MTAIPTQFTNYKIVETNLRGVRFGRWLRSAMENNNIGIVKLSEISKLPANKIREYVNDCMNDKDSLQLPTENHVEKIALALGLDKIDGMRAAGFKVDSVDDRSSVAIPFVDRMDEYSQVLNLKAQLDRHEVARHLVESEPCLDELFLVRCDRWLVCRRGRNALPGTTVVYNSGGVPEVGRYAHAGKRPVVGVVVASFD